MDWNDIPQAKGEPEFNNLYIGQSHSNFMCGLIVKIYELSSQSKSGWGGLGKMWI
jgi:hypothetical protein